MATDKGVSIQQDTLSPVDGGPIRTIQVVTPINGVPTTVQMQVIAIADERGVLLGQNEQEDQILLDVLAVLKDVRTLLAQWLGASVVDQTANTTTPGIQY